jgi:putative oxidoreductase
VVQVCGRSPGDRWRRRVLIPRLSGLAALGLIGLMAGATLTNVLVLGTSPLLPIALMLVSALVAWGRLPRTRTLFTNR